SKVFLPDIIQTAWNVVVAKKPEMPSIEFDIPDGMPLIRGDARRIKQIFSHLLSNAAKFAPKGGMVKVTVMDWADGSIDVSIADTGFGKEQDRIAHAQEPFKQLDGRLSRRFEGVGLGLPLANALIRLHGGKLTIASQPRIGTTVTVSFPPERVVPQEYAL